jgi:hypothetical protein
MRRLAWGVLVAGSIGLASGCGSKGAVSLTASIGDVNVSVEPLTLGTRLAGSFTLSLSVGPEAEADSQVSLESFALVRGAETLVDALEVVPESATFPLTVPKGGSRRVTFKIGSDTKLLEQEAKDRICAGNVQVVGAVRDSLSDGKITPLRGAEVTPSGC